MPVRLIHAPAPGLVKIGFVGYAPSLDRHALVAVLGAADVMEAA